MVRIAAYVLGILLILFGILGFLPMTAPKQMLLGVFHVNAAHNLVHIATGIVALTVSSVSAYASRLFFRVLGVGYVVISVLGVFSDEKPIFGVLASNMPNVALHTAVAIAALFLGFFFASEDKN